MIGGEFYKTLFTSVVGEYPHITLLDKFTLVTNTYIDKEWIICARVRKDIKRGISQEAYSDKYQYGEYYI